MIVYLVGMMGTGKTTIGQELAISLTGEFIDLDNYIENVAKETIADIFAKHGEPYFRKLETEALNELVMANQQTGQNEFNPTDMQRAHLIIATGGGAFINQVNRELMLNTGVVIWLIASPKEIANRLAHDNTRPLLQGTIHNKSEQKSEQESEQKSEQEQLLNKITTILGKRVETYGLANIHITTDGKLIKQIVNEILSELNYI